MQQTNTQRVISKVEQLIVLAKEKHGLTIPMPVIVFDIRKNSNLIGQCLYSDPRVNGKSKLRFNLSYMAIDIELYMETVIHEFSHLVVYIVYGGKCGHDARFARVVRSFGGKDTGATTDAYLRKRYDNVIGNTIAKQFKVGDSVEFTHSRTGKVHKLRIMKFSRDGAKITGVEVNAFVTWKVPVFMLRSSN